MRNVRTTAAIGTLSLIMGCGTPPTSERRSISYAEAHVGIYEVEASPDLVPLPDRQYYLNINFNLRSDDKQTDADALMAAINALLRPSKQKDIRQAQNNRSITFCAIKIYRDKKSQLGRFSSGIIIAIDEICSELAAEGIVSKTTFFPIPTIPNEATGGWSEVMIFQHSIGAERRDQAAIDPTDDKEGR